VAEERNDAIGERVGRCDQGEIHCGRRRCSSRRRWGGVGSGAVAPSVAASESRERDGETRNPFPTPRLVEPSPGDGRGIDAEILDRGRPNVYVGLTEEIGPWEWEAGEKEGNPPGWAATKQALSGM
jgi:hypothetical protein